MSCITWPISHFLIHVLVSPIDTEMHRWSSFYRKRSTTSFYVCMYVCIVGGQKQLHIWNPWPQFGYSLSHSYGAPMKNKGCLLLGPLMLKLKSSGKGQIFAVFRILGSEVKKVSSFTAKGTSIRESTFFEPFWANWFRVWPPGQLEKNKVTEDRIFHIFYSEAPTDPIVTKFGLGQISRTKSTVPHFIPIRSGFWFCRGSNFGLSHRNEVSPLTHLNYRSACDK